MNNNDVKQMKINGYINYFNHLSKEIAKSKSVSIKLSNRASSLILGWLINNMEDYNFSIKFEEFESDFINLLIAEIGLLKETSDDRKRYWLISEIN